MTVKTTKVKEEKKEQKNLVGTRGRTFEGTVTKKFDKRIVIEFERTVRVPKYERFMKKKTKLHVRITEGAEVKVGDYVQVMECRPLSKMIHFILTDIIKKTESVGDKK